MAGSLLLRDGVFVTPGGMMRGDLRAEGGRIAAIGEGLAPDGAEVIELGGRTAGPGFIDVHVHGGGGHSFFTQDAERVRAYKAWAPGNGVTSFLVSTVGRDADDTEAIFRALAPTVGESGGAEVLGFHMEGPFINPVRNGAFPKGMLRASSADEFARYQAAAGGLIRQVTLAPELPGALALIAAVTASGAIASMGHTDATTEECRTGFDAGIRHVTHLFNAMRPIHQREGGPIVAALLEERATCELICDGAHIDPQPLRMAYRVLGPQRTVVVTDNLHLAGMEQLSGRFAGEEVTVSGGKAAKADGTIVGSVETMDQHFRNTMTFLGVNSESAFQLCAANPARVAGAAKRKGQLAPGFDADVVVLDAQDRVLLTVCRGEVAFRR